MAARVARRGLFVLAAAAILAVPLPAGAQQHTFHLDRLEVPGAPDDGLVLFRPVTRPHTLLYGQFGLGLSVDPLRTRDITGIDSVLRASPSNVITSQFSTYLSAGFELFDRLILGTTFPIALEQAGNQPVFSRFGSAPPPSFSTTGPAVGDMRVDARYVVWRNEDRSAALGVQASVFLPTGSGSSTNFGGDGDVGFLFPTVTAEWTPVHFPTLVANLTLVHFRPENSISDPAGKFGSPQGLGVGNETRLAIGALLPILDGKVRLAGTLFGQTGVANDNTVGNTILSLQNTPLEWNVEGRMKLPIIGLEDCFVGAGTGTRILPGYGAPDFRLVAFIGTTWEIEDTNPHSPDAHARIRASIRESLKDTDGDGIPDDIDACPLEPEDHKEPDPSDGCPQQVDTDSDGIPDSKDACPKEPGQPDPDPRKNGCPKFIHLEGSTVRVLQQVHFETASATILPDSFPMLTEVVQLLKANPSIKKMRIEGHTDNRGGADYNLDLSKRRAASVREWLVQHGVESGRLESEGYGLTRPVESNDTDPGRAANRRVEFKILEEAGAAPAPQ